jgi:heptosyltransferase-2
MKDGYNVKFFRQRDTVTEYADDINECKYLICGDTLAMHLGLALGKMVVAVFTCTSPHEIYGYGTLAKVVSPQLEQHFYRREYSPEGANAISIEQVEAAFRTISTDGLISETGGSRRSDGISQRIAI